MLQLRGDAFSKIVTALLIAQLLLPSFSVCSAGAAAIKKRATTAAHDPDIVGQTAAAAVTAAADVVAKVESENVTKLLPQGSGVGGIQQQETAMVLNGSMLLHKVQEKSAAVSVEDEQNESIAGRSMNSLELPQATESPKEQSARLFGVAAHNKVSDAAVDNNINDGLDSAALEQQYSAGSLGLDDERAQQIGNNVDLTTEGILPEIEQVAAHVVRQNDSVVELHPPNEVEIDKAQQQARAEKLDEEFVRATVGVAVTTTTEMPNVAQENVTAAVEGGENNATMLPQPRGAATAASDNNNSTDRMPTTTTTTATTASQLDASPASKAHTHFSEESNEIHVNAGSAEKRAKFISDNATNAQQLQLPDAAEVWTLAAMKTLPKTNATMTTTLAPPEVRQAEEQQLEQTEQPLNGNSEKNLLDWTQIMMSGELLAKQNDNFLQYSTTTQRSGAVPDETPQLFENRTEAMLQANVDATDESVEPLTKQTMQATAVNSQPLPKDKVKEIRVESTAEHSLRPELLQPTSTAAPAAVATPYSTAHQAATSLAAVAVAATAAMASSTEAILSQATDKGDNNAISNATAATSETETAELAVEQRSAEMYESATTVLPAATEASMTTATATPVAMPLPEITKTTTVSNLPTTMRNTTATTAPPPAFSALPAYNETLTQVKTNYDNASSAAYANASAARDDTQFELFPSATTTVSTLATGELNASTISNASPPPPEYTGARHETVAELGITDTTTTTASPTVLPDFLASSTTTVSNLSEQQLTATTTTEVAGQTADEVNLLHARSELEQNLATSTIGTLLKLADETDATAATEALGIETTTTSAINELLKQQKSESNNTQAAAIVTLTAEQTTLKPVVESTTTITTTTTATPTTGSTSTTVFFATTAAQTTTTTTSTQAPPVSLAPTLVKPTAAVKGQLSHESEASIETNDIDPLDKKQPTTPSSTNATEQPAHETDLPLREEHQANTLAEELQPNNEHRLLPQTTTIMGSSMLNITATTTEAPTTTTSHTSTTTTEPPLISLLDDSTTTTSTPASISTKLEDIYAVFSSTQGVPLATSITPEPATTTTTEAVDIAPTTALPTQIVLSTAVPSITTMLPPLQASIGGGASPGMPVMPSGNLQPNSADASETDVNVIIAISVSVIGVVALILLVAFLYLMRKRQKQMSYGQRCRPVSLDAYSLDNVSVLGSVRRKGALRASKRSYGNVAFDDPSLRHNVLTAAELAKFVERRTSIFEEFRDVPQIHARADEVPPGCEDKNRYANVIPLPETRVILQQQNDDEKTEYINANYVRGPKDTPNYYIGCQAPLESTAADFWRMIWEQQSRVIIQATDLIENGIEKCADYLPPSVTLDNHTTYGDFQVTLKHREVKDRYAISTVMLKNTVADASRELTHYWYKWPETGVPGEEAPIIAMLLEARSSLKSYAVEQTNELKEKSSSLTLKADDVSVVQVTPVNADADTKEPASVPVSSSNGEINGNVSPEKLKVATKSQGPLTVHCSPGTGRTGTIIACDMAIRSLETPKRSVDIPQIVYYVRRGRASAVQTKEQYEFIYKVANMYATKITNISHDN